MVDGNGQAFTLAKNSSFQLILLSAFFFFANALFLEAEPAYKVLTLPGALRTECEPFRKQYQNPFGEKKLRTILENGETYRLYVRAQIKKRQLPAELEYLPVIESEYLPHARSKDGKGVGMWQFMMNSVKPFLTVNEWIDERLDPWKETDAALSKLTDNYKMFGDWILAIAAYNCGAGAMQRALQKTQEKSFWAVAQTPYIPEHTKRYIPKFLAIADLAENSAYYGLNLPDAKNKNGNPINPDTEKFDYIETNQVIPLRLFAAELRIDISILEELNPALIYKMTPPEQSYNLRLPTGMKEPAQYYLDSQIKNQAEQKRSLQNFQKQN